MLRRHLGDHGTTPDGRAVPRRPRRDAQRVGLRPRMARRPPGRPRPRPGRHRACPPPYDLRHAALSLWLNATGTPAEVAARAGTSTRVLHEVYLHCTDGQDDAVSQRIEDALDAGTGITHSSPHTKASGYPHRRHHPRPGPLYVHELVPGPAYSPRPPGPASPRCRMQTSSVTSISAAQTVSEAIPAKAGPCPDPAHA